jgi:transcriptional regulator NrdR family protein
MATAPRRARTDELAAGLECSKCGCRHVPVLYTRRLPGRIVRVRECRCCGRRLRTVERISGMIARS